MGITCSKNESFVLFIYLFLSWELVCMGTQKEKSSIPLPLIWLGKEKFRRDGRRAKKQKGRRAGA